MKKTIFSVVFVIFLTCLFTFIASLSPGIFAAENSPAPVRFAIMGDRTSGMVPGIFDSIIREVQILRPDFVMTVGDMIEGYVDDTLVMNKKWEEFLTLVEPLTMPIYYTPGNNDIFSDKSETWYPGHIGERYYSFDYNDLHFIILDNSRIELSTESPAEQLDWLAGNLAENSNAAHTFVFMHKPFWYNSTAENQPDTLHTLFVKYGVDAVFTVHYHDYFSGEYDGIIYTSLGSSGGGTRVAPTGLEYHFCWVTVDAYGIHIAIIDKGSVRPWDEITAGDRKTYNPIRRAGLTFDDPLEAAANLTVAASAGKLTLHNGFSDQPLDDTLRWDVPDNWTVEPAVMPVTAAPGENKIFAFTAACAGPLYPVPTASVNFTYAEGKKVEATAELYLARTAECFPVDKKVTIDGKLDEPCWQKPQTTFFDESGRGNIDHTEFYFAYDRDNLYLAARCTDAVMDSIKAKITEHDGAVYGEDCVGYFISPSNSLDTVYQIYFNPLGTPYDHKLFKMPDTYWDFVRDWNAEYEVKAHKYAEFWSIEVKIPIQQLGVENINKGEKWRVNFRRKQFRPGTAGDWQLPIGYPDYRGGYLIMR